MGFNKNSRDKLPDYHKKSEVKNIISEAQNENKRDYLILKTLWETGLRVSELANLKRKDLDFENNELKVRSGKGGKDRIIPLTNSLSDLLDVKFGDLKQNEFLFDISDRQIRNIVKKYGKKAGIDTHPHKFRHSFAINCLRSGMDLRTLQRLLGHSDLSTTQVYLQITADDVKNEFRKVKF